AIFPLFYLPPIGYFSALKELDFEFTIEMHEHFPKQTYRNRASIYSPNGVLDLTVPVVKGAKVHTKVKDVRISNEFNWQRLHWKTFETCYRSSAYFEYYEDEFAQFYHKKYSHLFEFNMELFQWLMGQLKKDVDYNFTEEYFLEVGEGLDFRSRWKVNDKDVDADLRPYFQVFDDRHGFKPNLSISDLLFNQGPRSLSYF
ncbi:MAG: hypothetical protein EOP48_30050, partial [Sphingobacteriales bacterium]